MPKHKLVCLIGQLGNGGSEKQLFLFLQNLDREKYSPVVVVSSAVSANIWEDKFENELQVPVVSLGKWLACLKFVVFRYLVFKYKPEIVYSWSFYTNAFQSVSGNARFIGSLRGGIDEEREQLSAGHFQLCLKPDTLVVNSQLLKQELLGEGIAENRISLILNIFESSSFPETLDGSKKKSIREQYGLPEEAIIIAGAGRKSPSKDFPFFVEVIESALKKGLNLHGFLLGQGGELVKEMVSSKGLDDYFTIPGEVPEARSLLPAADIFFLSSKLEGLPNILLEAIDAGCAILTTDAGGVRDILGDDKEMLRKFLIAERNVETGTELLTNIVRDESLKAKISEYSRQQLDKFSVDKIMPAYLNLFEG